MISAIRSARRPSVLLIVLAMLACIVGTAVVAAARPDAVLAHEADCDITNDNERWTGENDVQPGYSIRAIQADIDPLEATFRVASHGFAVNCGNEADSTSAFVELFDSSASTNKFQIGVWRCNEYIDPTWCDTGGGEDGTELHWFAVSSGCGNGVGIANLGDANYQNNTFKLKRVGNDLEGYVNDTLKYTTNWTTHPRLSCWLDGSETVKGRVGAWVADGGSASAHSDDYLNFSAAQFLPWTSSTWLSPGWNSSQACDRVYSSNQLASYCDVTGGNSFNVSTDHQ